MSPELLAARGLPPGSIVLADSSALVYYIEGPPPRQAAVASFMELAAQGALSLVASTLAWTELLEKPLNSGRKELADRYRRLLADSSRIVLVPVDVAVAEEAARIRARSTVSLADSIHLATARVAGARALLTNDSSWREAMPDLDVVLVDELAAELALGADEPMEGKFKQIR